MRIPKNGGATPTGSRSWNPKRWLRPLDRRTSGRRGAEEQSALSIQMLRYLWRVGDLTGCKLLDGAGQAYQERGQARFRVPAAATRARATSR
jgi:hypothetical protein